MESWPAAPGAAAAAATTTITTTMGNEQHEHKQASPASAGQKVVPKNTFPFFGKAIFYGHTVTEFLMHTHRHTYSYKYLHVCVYFEYV